MPEQRPRPTTRLPPRTLSPSTAGPVTRSPVRDGLRAMDYGTGARTVAPTATTGDDVTGPNALLFQHATTGASRSTAKGNGVAGSGVTASETMADQDRERLLAMQETFVKVAAAHNLPPALLAAIASRETRGGNQLDRNGYSIWDGNGFGVMQVDKNSHTPVGGARSFDHINHAASILAGYRDQIAKKFPTWKPDQVLQAAVYAYNAGPSRVKSLETLDQLSTGKDYSSDVWARARHLSSDFGGAPRQGT